MAVISSRPRSAIWPAFLALLPLLLLSGFRPLPGVRSEPQAQALPPLRGGAALAQVILRQATTALGWTATLAPRPDLPGQTWQIANPAEGPALLSLLVSVAAQTDEQTMLEQLVARGLTSGLFHGREAIILHPGDALPPSGSGTRLAPGGRSQRGLIAWRCGPYALAAVDESGTGLETRLAETLYQAAERRALCGLPASLVILARTADMPAGNMLDPQVMARMAQHYYDANAYGRVNLELTFLDAEPSTPSPDWFLVGPSHATFKDRPFEFAVAALRQALAHRRIAPAAYVERAIIMCPAEAKAQISGGPGPMVIREPNGGRSLIQLPANGALVELNEVVLLADDHGLGAWVHELGHTLYSRHLSPSGHHRITDRYNAAAYGPGLDYGELRGWDVMAAGDYSGRLDSPPPIHMSSYTKVAANWLRQVSATLGVDVTLMALEHQGIGDTVLIMDYPLTDDPRSYFIVEARDRDTAYGPPQSGVVLYLVTYSDQKGHAVVNQVHAADSAYAVWNLIDRSVRPTLYGVGQPDGVTQIDLVGGYRVTLVSEQFQPYRATVRIERR
jgi:hypothetical protein